MQRRGRIRRWLKPVLALPGTVEGLKVWGGWLAKAWAWLLVVAPVPTYWIRGWLVDRIFEVAVVGASLVVSAYGVRMLRAQARRPDPEVERLKALVPRIREARDTYYRTGPGEDLRFISLTVETGRALGSAGCPLPRRARDGERNWSVAAVLGEVAAVGRTGTTGRGSHPYVSSRC